MSPSITIVSSSQAENSRSRLAARYAEESLKAANVNVDFIDLADYDILTYPKSNDDATLKTLVERFNAADGWVLAVPVYNWGPSGTLLNFLHYTLGGVQRYRPFIIIGAAGGMRATLALDGLARTMVYEISAVQVGPALLGTAKEIDRDAGLVQTEMQKRIQRATHALQHFAAAAKSLEQSE